MRGVEHLLGDALAHRLVDAVLAIAHQRFAGNFQQHALVAQRGRSAGRISARLMDAHLYDQAGTAKSAAIRRSSRKAKGADLAARAFRIEVT